MRNDIVADIYHKYTHTHTQDWKKNESEGYVLPTPSSLHIKKMNSVEWKCYNLTL